MTIDTTAEATEILKMLRFRNTENFDMYVPKLAAFLDRVVAQAQQDLSAKLKRRTYELECLANEESPTFKEENGVCVEPHCGWPFHTHNLFKNPP